MLPPRYAATLVHRVGVTPATAYHELNDMLEANGALEACADMWPGSGWPALREAEPGNSRPRQPCHRRTTCYCRPSRLATARHCDLPRRAQQEATTAALEHQRTCPRPHRASGSVSAPPRASFLISMIFLVIVPSCSSLRTSIVPGLPLQPAIGPSVLLAQWRTTPSAATGRTRCSPS